MSKLAIILVLLAAWLGGITQIARSNELKRQAKAAYANKQYAVAAKAWAELLQLEKTPNPAVRLNLAHALRLQNQKLKAAREYQQVVKSGSPELQSVAHLQLGNLLAQAQEYEKALSSYKQALKADAKNNQARYNYELLRKYLDRQKNEEEQPEQEPEKQQPNQQQPQEEPQSQSQGGQQNQQQQPGENGTEKPVPQGSKSGSELGRNNQETDSAESKSPPLPPQTGQKADLPGEETSVRRLEQIRMTDERARALLNAMRNAELQYLQQLPRKQRSRPEPNKPDW